MPESTPKPTTDRIPVKLYWAAPLPMHYIAQDDQGDLWMLPVTPLSPETWEHRRSRYLGNYVLYPVRPQTIIEQYRRKPGLRTPGRPSSGVQLVRVQVSISSEHASVLDEIAGRTGQPRREIIERALQIAYPEEFPDAIEPAS